MSKIISAAEAMREHTTRLQVYRAAVQHGFYNEGPGTIAFRGFHIIPESDGRYLIMHGSQYMIAMKDVHVAKVWITCRLDNLSLVEANKKLRSES
jgi:hypothetical protein